MYGLFESTVGAWELRHPRKNDAPRQFDGRGAYL